MRSLRVVICCVLGLKKISLWAEPAAVDRVDDDTIHCDG